MLTLRKRHIANSDTVADCRGYDQVAATQITRTKGSIVVSLSPKVTHLTTDTAAGWKLIETKVKQLLSGPVQNHKVDRSLIFLPLHSQNGVLEINSGNLGVRFDIPGD